MQFAGCAAAKSDPELALIAEIKDDRERTLRLFEYLGVGVGEPLAEVDGGPSVPEGRPAPLETQVKNERLTLVLPADPPLPPGPVQDRARIGWEAITEALGDLKRSVNLENYRSLAAAAGALNRALGRAFEDMNAIKVGIAGQALAELARDGAFMDTLPDGAGAQVKAIAATVSTFSNRFPEWLAYQEDAVQAQMVAAQVQESLSAFEELAKTLERADDVDRDVVDEFRKQLDWARTAPTSEVAARGLLASTRELLRTLAENIVLGARMYVEGAGRAMVSEFRAIKAIVPNEVRKTTFWGAIAVAGDIILLKGAMLTALSAKFPWLLGWVDDVLRWAGVI